MWISLPLLIYIRSNILKSSWKSLRYQNEKMLFFPHSNQWHNRKYRIITVPRNSHTKAQQIIEITHKLFDLGTYYNRFLLDFFSSSIYSFRSLWKCTYTDWRQTKSYVITVADNQNTTRKLKQICFKSKYKYAIQCLPK